ncbi:AAA family ATPase [Pseudomonas eucalypticola]|uniref:AAA family ATPase n=1 Tax=Pseudomonas eucalypticola TaxID=2599595 RepID=A0A7D5H417_9PSED|nr:AAA family ATPase [Pseudomonas eucalypticola]QKZ03383.1 AAA family ATPase [Pseudomonas eucalypticola]
MYIRSLSVRNLKRLRDLTLDFTDAQGNPRMWTVIIGENGTGKTSILQAIALASAGKLRVNDLASTAFAHLVDRRHKHKQPLSIRAQFSFTPSSLADRKCHPLYEGTLPLDLRLTSQVSLDPKETSIRADAWYGVDEEQPGGAQDPLDQARAKESHLWFVIGYGVHRTLPESGRVSVLSRPSVDRMKPLFGPEYPLTSTSFLGHYGSRSAKARVYSTVLKKAIINTGVLPHDIANLEMRGYGGVSKAADLLDRDRFLQAMGSEKVKIPAVALAHGYQSTIAWIADLVGHILLEAKGDLHPEDFEGLVLIDEIDLYLHPTWQARLIPALRKTFPKLQFVATTHSPVVLATLAPDEVIRVQADAATGDVHRIAPDAETGIWEEVEDEPCALTQPDPRTMTGTEMYQEYFGLDRLTLNEHGEQLRSYTALATNPYRTPYQQEKMEKLKLQLTTALVADLVEPVAVDPGQNSHD